MDRKPKHLTEEGFRLIAGRFRVLSEPMRLKILHSLQDGERTVNELVADTGGEQANVSKHLGILLVNGLVARRREGTSAFYRVADPSIFGLCRTVCSSLDDHLASDHAAIRTLVEK
jgi:DNA-binding transcriptional ArsR family regulator